MCYIFHAPCKKPLLHRFPLFKIQLLDSVFKSFFPTDVSHAFDLPPNIKETYHSHTRSILSPLTFELNHSYISTLLCTALAPFSTPLLASLSVANCSSKVARFLAIQALLPAPKANQYFAISSAPLSHLSGLKASGSGKMAGFKCSS